MIHDILHPEGQQSDAPHHGVNAHRKKREGSEVARLFSKLLAGLHVPGTERGLLTDEFALMPRQGLRHGFLPREGKADMAARRIAQESW
jgi:hypothetical protein